MQIYEGKSVFGGIAMGKIRVYKKDENQVKRQKIADEEAEAARRAGLLSVSLGPRILRCETAPLAALAAVMYESGNF